MDRITRYWTLDGADVRAADDEDANYLATFRGHAAVFGQPTLIGSRTFGFIEQIEERAFDNVLEDDVRFLVNHGGLPHARTTNGTLRLGQDATGLTNEADIARTSAGKDLVTLLKRGDVNQQSFAFTINDNIRWDEVELEDGDTIPRRTIAAGGIARLFDTSVVTYPAYEGATGGLARAYGVNETEIRTALANLTSDREAEERQAEHARLLDERRTSLRARLR